jgi:hypothetical protein
MIADRESWSCSFPPYSRWKLPTPFIQRSSRAALPQEILPPSDRHPSRELGPAPINLAIASSRPRSFARGQPASVSTIACTSPWPIGNDAISLRRTRSSCVRSSRSILSSKTFLPYKTALLVSYVSVIVSISTYSNKANSRARKYAGFYSCAGFVTNDRSRATKHCSHLKASSFRDGTSTRGPSHYSRR